MIQIENGFCFNKKIKIPENVKRVFFDEVNVNELCLIINVSDFHKAFFFF